VINKKTEFLKVHLTNPPTICWIKEIGNGIWSVTYPSVLLRFFFDQKKIKEKGINKLFRNIGLGIRRRGYHASTII